jgi:hypothetical protein
MLKSQNIKHRQENKRSADYQRKFATIIVCGYWSTYQYKQQLPLPLSKLYSDKYRSKSNTRSPTRPRRK